MLTDGIEQILFGAPHAAYSFSHDDLALAFASCPGPLPLRRPPAPASAVHQPCTQPALHQSGRRDSVCCELYFPPGSTAFVVPHCQNNCCTKANGHRLYITALPLCTHTHNPEPCKTCAHTHTCTHVVVGSMATQAVPPCCPTCPWLSV